jgi:RecA/RadA recombinase
MGRSLEENNEKDKKSIKKKEFSFESFKEKIKIDLTEEMKPVSWLPMREAYKKALGLQGIPKGELTLVRGYSDTGKSSFVYEAVVAAQQNGELPVIIDTENAVKIDHLKKIGFDPNLPYLYIDTDYLLKNYGKRYNKEFKEASIEDIGEFMHDILDAQEKDELQMDVVFCIDSFGSTDCRKTLSAKEKDKEANNMWNAGAMEQTFKGIFHQRIPMTRKTSRKYTATAIGVQKIWFDSQAGGQGVVRHKGGESAYSVARLIIHVGGVKTRGVEKLSITKNKKVTNLGISASVKVVKNHVSNITFEGKLISTAYGLVHEDDFEDFKEKYVPEMLKEIDETSDGDYEVISVLDNSDEE